MFIYIRVLRVLNGHIYHVLYAADDCVAQRATAV